MNLRPAFAFTASFILAAASYLAPLGASAQTATAKSTTTIRGAVLTTNGNTTTVTGTGTSTTGTTPAETPPTDTATPAPPPPPSVVTGGITGARDAFVLTCVFDVRTTPLSFVVFQASGTMTAPPIAPGSFCSQALGTLLSSGFTLAASLPTFEGATQYTLVR
jgi:hypothetical protein